jgi:hypothetical protein
MDEIVGRGFTKKISLGKYSRWASKMGPDTLEALLWAVGEYGSRFNSLTREIGFFAGPFFCLNSSVEVRVQGALATLATIQCGDPIGWHIPSGWDRGFSSKGGAFSHEYRQPLSQGKHTTWAVELDERALAMLLWMVGEYAARYHPEGPPPRFGGNGEDERTMRAALRLVLRLVERIRQGQATSLDDAKRFIREEAFDDDEAFRQQ